MKKLLILFTLATGSLHLSGQVLDLIVTSSGDSVACKIDSISSSNIYLAGWINGSSVKTSVELNNVSEYKFKHLKRGNITWIPGTMYFKTKDATERNIKKNSFYGTLGFILAYAAVDVNYERILSYNPEKFFSTVSLRIGYGGYSTWGLAGPLWVTTANVLTGSKKSHIEINFGFTVMKDNWDNSKTLNPAGGLGYRFQKPDGGLVFRTGLSFPESVYLSIGFNF